MNEEDVQRQLEELKARSSPPVNAGFADNLESHLRVTAAEINHGGRRSGARRPIWQPLGGIVLVAAVLIAGTVALFRSQQSSADLLVMTAAEDTSVILPTGSVVNGVEGLPLPDGTRIEVGLNGGATISDVVLASGAIAVVTDGDLEIIRDRAPGQTTTTLPPTTLPPTTRPPTTEPPTTRPPTTTGSTASDPPTSPPRATDRPSTSSTTAATSPTSARDTPGTTGPVGFNPLLRAGPPTRDGTTLEWVVAQTDGIAGWEVIGQRGDEVRTVALIREASTTQLTVAQPETGFVRYWVLARSADGGVIGESNRLTITAG